MSEAIQATSNVHREARRILKRYGTMTVREIRRAGPEWVAVEHNANEQCPACGASAMHVTYHEATKGPQPNTLLEDACCNACGHRYEYHVASVPNSGCDPRDWTPDGKA